jgi:hypothetical protein
LDTGLLRETNAKPQKTDPENLRNPDNKLKKGKVENRGQPTPQPLNILLKPSGSNTCKMDSRTSSTSETEEIVVQMTDESNSVNSEPITQVKKSASTFSALDDAKFARFHIKAILVAGIGYAGVNVMLSDDVI